MRLFIALQLPDEIRSRLAILCHGLPGAKWVAPENLHLTLRFLGEIDGHVAEDVDAALSGLHCPAFEMTMTGVDTFADGRRVRSLWVGVQASETLNRLQGKIEQAVTRAGLPPEKRKFKPHVTLARFKSDPGPRLPAYLAEHALFRAGPFPVADFVLYSSLLKHTGAHYAPEAVYPLDGVPVSG